MKVKDFIFKIVIFFSLITILCNSISYASDKKGIGIADLNASQRVKALNVSWYYTWKPYPIKNLNDIEFVPMVWGGKRAVSEIKNIKNNYGKVKYLLFLNEPDQPDQANMNIEESIELLKEVQNLAEEISSPACAGGINKWCQEFLEVVKKNNLKITFLAVHFYLPPDSKTFLEKIDQIYKKYKMPIWITEFAVADWEAKKFGKNNRYSEQEVLKFMQEVLPELEKRDYVVRYAWFGAGKNCQKKEQIRTSCLFDEKEKLTLIGLFYSKFKSEKKSM